MLIWILSDKTVSFWDIYDSDISQKDTYIDQKELLISCRVAFENFDFENRLRLGTGMVPCLTCEYCTSTKFVLEPYPYPTVTDFRNQNSQKLLDKILKVKKDSDRARFTLSENIPTLNFGRVFFKNVLKYL